MADPKWTKGMAVEVSRGPGDTTNDRVKRVITRGGEVAWVVTEKNGSYRPNGWAPDRRPRTLKFGESPYRARIRPLTSESNGEVDGDARIPTR
jgi:hypothetical protein